MYARLMAAIDALLHFVRAHARLDAPLTTDEEEELGRFDQQLAGFCRGAGLSIPEVTAHSRSPYTPYGNAQIPHYRTNRGLHISASPNWLQALGGLRRTAEILMEAPEKWAAGPSRAVGAGQPGETRLDAAERWLTVSAAAQTAHVNRGVISRAVESGRLLSNGSRGPERRVCAMDLCRWIRERSGHPEPTESRAHVEALVRRYVRD
jgi:hypothetical protein